MAKINKGAAKASIDKFIRSRRTLLPTNSAWYQSGNIREDFCLFCNEVHEDVMVLYRPTLNSSLRLLEGVNICTKCELYLGEKDGAHKMEDIFEKFSEMAGQDVVTRLDDFVYEGIFPADTHKHYSHLNSEEEPYKLCDEKCVFCKGFTGGHKITAEVEVYKEIPVPVGSEHYYLDGGMVRICSSCNLILSSRLPNGYLQHILTYSGYDKCPKCDDQYLVMNLEMDARKSDNSFGHHTCPECTYKNLISQHSLKYGDEDLFSMYAAARDSETHKISRFNSKDCQTCSQQIGIDVTYSADYILSHFISKGGKYTCEDCMFMDNSPQEVVHIQGKIARIYSIKNKFYIKETTKSGKLVHLYHDLSSQEVINYLLKKNGTQTELEL
jgi:hypothetical protein